MRKRAAFIVLLVFLASLFACTAGKDEFEELGSKFVEQLADGQFEDAASTFDETMSAKVSPEQLKEIWDQLQEQTGAFQNQLSTRRGTIDKYEIVYVTCQFDNSKLDVKVVYDKSKQVAGLWFVPTGTQ